MRGDGGKKTREAMIKSFEGILQSKAGAPDLISSFYQQRALSGDDFTKVYGSADEFLTRYSQFEQKYFNALDTNLKNAGTNKVLVDLQKKRGIIDLSLLDRETGDALMHEFKTEVMRTEKLMQHAGLPTIQMPSANLYRSAFKFEVDNSKGITHPAQILINRMMFNYNSEKTGLESISLNRRNMFGANTIKEFWGQFKKNAGDLTAQLNPFGDLRVGQKVVTFDVETTGVFSGSQVRSFAASEMEMTADGLKLLTRAPGDPMAIKGLGFASPQMYGMVVGNIRDSGTKTLNEFIMDVEHGTDDIAKLAKREMGEGGKTFLDESTKFIERLLDADRLAGHNVHFDITMMTSTMMDQEGFAEHAGAQRAIGNLYEKINKGNYLVDTLESTRAYLQNEASNIVSQMGDIKDVEKRSNAFVRTLMAETKQAQVQIGKSATYADVGNIALNTNLFELIEQDGQAEALFNQIKKGSHIAETDVHLQGYIGKYVQEGKLKIRTGIDQIDQSTGVLAKSEFGNFARNVIGKSQAITSTTNIASVAHINQTVFDFLQTNEGITRVQLAGTAQELGLDIGTGPRDVSGVLTYSGKDKGFKFSTADEVFDLDTVSTRESIKNVLSEARNAEVNGGVQGTLKIGSKTVNVTRNLADERILSLGIDFGTNSRAIELANTGRISVAAAPAIQDIADALGSSYRTLGTGLSLADQSRVNRGRSPIETVFRGGVADFNLQAATEMASKFAKAGDVYAPFVDARSRAFSTSVANATAGVGRKVGRKVTDAASSTLLAHTSNTHLLTEFGYSYWENQKALRLLSSTDKVPSSRVMVPPKMLTQALSMNGIDSVAGVGPEMSMRIGLSVVDDQSAVNGVWHIGEQLDRTQARQLAMNLLELSGDEQEMAKVFDMTADELRADNNLMPQITRAKQYKIPKGPNAVMDDATSSIVDELTESFMERGIGVLRNEGDTASNIIKVLGDSGMLGDQDVLMPLRADMLVSGMEEHSLLSPFMDREAIKIQGLEAELAQASKVVDAGDGKRASRSVLTLNEVSRTLDLDESQKVKIGRRVAREKIGLGENKLLDFYFTHKTKIGWGALGVAAAGAGYYMYKKHRESNLYDETLQQQPLERGSAVASANRNVNQVNQMEPEPSDPLVTAGVVGNLDRMKIGHTRMGNNKYNHLYGA